MIRTVNSVLPGVKRPFRLQDVQFIYDSLNSALAGGVGATPRVLSGFDLKDDGNLSAGVIAFNGKLYYHPDTDGYRIPLGGTVYAGDVPSEDDMRPFKDGTVQPMYYYNILTTTATGNVLVGAFTEKNLEDWRAFGGSGDVKIFPLPMRSLIESSQTTTISNNVFDSISSALNDNKAVIFYDKNTEIDQPLFCMITRYSISPYGIYLYLNYVSGSMKFLIAQLQLIKGETNTTVTNVIGTKVAVSGKLGGNDSDVTVSQNVNFTGTLQKNGINVFNTVSVNIPFYKALVDGATVTFPTSQFDTLLAGYNANCAILLVDNNVASAKLSTFLRITSTTSTVVKGVVNSPLVDTTIGNRSYNVTITRTNSTSSSVALEGESKSDLIGLLTGSPKTFTPDYPVNFTNGATMNGVDLTQHVAIYDLKIRGVVENSTSLTIANSIFESILADLTAKRVIYFVDKQSDGTNPLFCPIGRYSITAANDTLILFLSYTSGNTSLISSQIKFTKGASTTSITNVAGIINYLKNAPNVITTDNLANNSVTNAKLGVNAVADLNMQQNSVGTSQIKDGNVTNAKLADGAVTGIKIAEKTITGGRIADNTIAAAQLATGAVTSEKIAALAVTVDKIGNNAVTGSKIADGHITTAKLADNSVTASKIVDNTIGNQELADNCILNRNIVVGTIGGTKLANGGVTVDKLATGAVTKAKVVYTGTNCAIPIVFAGSTGAGTSGTYAIKFNPLGAAVAEALWESIQGRHRIRLTGPTASLFNDCNVQVTPGYTNDTSDGYGSLFFTSGGVNISGGQINIYIYVRKSDGTIPSGSAIPSCDYQITLKTV